MCKLYGQPLVHACSNEHVSSPKPFRKSLHWLYIPNRRHIGNLAPHMCHPAQLPVPFYLIYEVHMHVTACQHIHIRDVMQQLPQEWQSILYRNVQNEGNTTGIGSCSLCHTTLTQCYFEAYCDQSRPRRSQLFCKTNMPASSDTALQHWSCCVLQCFICQQRHWLHACPQLHLHHKQTLHITFKVVYKKGQQYALIFVSDYLIVILHQPQPACNILLKRLLHFGILLLIMLVCFIKCQ